MLPALLSVADFQRALNEAPIPLMVVDASYYLPHELKDASALYRQEQIPTACFFDIEAVCDTTSLLPHMLPTPEQLERALQSFGVTPDSWIVVYDQKGVFSSPRFWWMCHALGWERVSVLDGGLPAWKAAGGAVVSQGQESSAKRSTLPLGLARREAWVATLPQVQSAIDDVQTCILDARGADRFHGRVPEPRAGLKSGHIPSSCNVPYPEVLNPETGCYQPLNVLEERLADALTHPRVITTCGSGVTACILTLAFYLLGKHPLAVYDGSWAEYGQL